MGKEIKATFIRTAKKEGSNKLKAILPDRDQGGEFLDCTDEVKAFATSNFNDGDAVVLTTGKVDDLFTIVKIAADSVQESGPDEEERTPDPVEPKSEPVEEEKAVAPKESTAKPVENPRSTASPKTKPPYQSMNTYGANFQKEYTPETVERMLRLSVFASACTAVTSLQGQVDLNSIGEVTIALYNKGLIEIKK